MLQQPLIDANAALVPLGVALGLSVAIERVVEFIKNLSATIKIPRRDRELPSLAGALAPTDALVRLAQRDDDGKADEQRGDALKAQIDDLEARIGKAGSPAEAAQLEIQLDTLKASLAELKLDGVWDEQYPTSTILVDPATSRDQSAALRSFSILAIASALGIIAAHYSHVGIFAPLIGALGHGSIDPAVDYLLTGLFIGGGSGPAHLLIRFISDRAVPMPRQEVKASAIPGAAIGEARTAGEAEAMATSLPSSSVSAVAPVSVAEAPSVAVAAPPATTALPWTDIAYDGGVDRDILEAVHRRSDDPNKIVFHHTAMHSKSTFQDVVRVIKGRTDKKGNHWLTGYHCVVLFDGSIHPFCRWDRYGSHAEGHNNRSLGITFNGNFETDPSVPYSNPSGRYGATRPSTAQLDAGARVVALWCHLYGIDADFEKAIIPHKWIATTKKTCPGSHFPYDDFKRLVTLYYETWKGSDEAKARIAAFAHRPYLFSGSRSAAWV